MKVICAIILSFSIFTTMGLAFGGGDNLPKMRKGDSYSSVRRKLIAAGWQPFHKRGADRCERGDKRCQGRPEMEMCAGTGDANCIFLFKRAGRTLEIDTIGENVAVYDGRKFR